MGSLLLKLHTRATEDQVAYSSYYFRETTIRGTVQIQVDVHLDENLNPVKAYCRHYTVHMMWAELFEEITPESTDKFAWINEKGEPDPDALAESIAITAFALLR